MPLAYREVDVLEVKEVLRRWFAGAKKKQIARELRLCPRTVRRYLGWAEEESSARPGTGEVPVGDALDVLVRAVAGRRKEGFGRNRGAAWAACLEHEATIRDLLATMHLGRPLTLRKVHKLLKGKRVSVPYSTLHRFVVEVLGHGSPEVTVPVADGEPGKELQIDTGWVGELPDAQGEKRRMKAWIFTAVVSRYRFVYPITRETTEEAIEACEAAWAFYGGVFEVVIPDNTKAIVAKPSPLAPVLVRVFLEYSQARGFFVDTARVRSPKDKPRVEGSVRYVRNDCFAGVPLRDVESARTHAARWCREEAGVTVCRTTRRQPLEHFEAVEKAVLKPAPSTPYDTPKWTVARVGSDQFVQVALALYSLPVEYRRQQVEVRADRHTVRLFFDDELIKAHERVAPGQRCMDPSHFPAERFATAQRDGAHFVKKGAEQHELIGKYAKALLDSPLPWTRMRHVHALLRLPTKYGVERVAAACRVALENGLFDALRLEAVIQQGRPDSAAPAPAAPSGRVIPVPKHLRAPSSYALPQGPRGGPTNDDKETRV